jgi:hypothetical protein
MKGNKTLILVLIIVVCGIWGAVGYQIFQAMSDSDPIVQNYNTTKKTSNSADTVEQASLSLRYSDPFLSKRFSKRKRQTSATVNTAITQNEKVARANRAALANRRQTAMPVVTRNLPNVAYLGVLVNRTSKQEQAIITLNDKELMLSEGEVYQEKYLLKSITLDSIIIEVEGEELVINKTY